jgi:hypothetical protein
VKSLSFDLRRAAIRIVGALEYLSSRAQEYWVLNASTSASARKNFDDLFVTSLAKSRDQTGAAMSEFPA